MVRPNSITERKLRNVEGVGPDLAGRIADELGDEATDASIHSLMQIHGVGRELASRIRSSISS